MIIVAFEDHAEPFGIIISYALQEGVKSIRTRYMNRAIDYANAWLLGIKYLFFIGFLLFMAFVSSAWAAAPVLLVIELLGLHINEDKILWVGIIVFTPVWIGRGLPKLINDEVL